MIATILPGSSGFHAVRYNENKVAKGDARLLEIKNFDFYDVLGTYNPQQLVDYLMDYSSMNDRVKKPQFHVAISCKGHENTEQELLEFAHEYLREMGYGEEGQPVLVYSHYDNANTHLHIITSRVSPSGKKISDSLERRRSLAAVDKILGINRQSKVDHDLEKVKSYAFGSISQVKAIFESLGYEFYCKEDKAYIKYGGRVVKELPESEFSQLFKYNYQSKNRNSQLRLILLKYRNTSADRSELTAELKKKFGVDLVFFGKADSPFGYMIVDHSNKTVINGAKVLSVNRLLDFATPEERYERVETLIDDILTNNPKMDVWDINKKLRKTQAYIKKDTVYYYGNSHKLPEHIVSAIQRNNRIAWIESFHPSTEAERDMLLRISKVNRPDLISLSVDHDTSYNNDVAELRAIFDNPVVENVRAKLSGMGYRLHRDDENTYAISFSGKRIINLTAEGFDLSRLTWRSDRKKQSQDSSVKPKQKQQTHQKPVIAFRPLRDVGGGSQGGKREWEVGHQGNYDEIDDERTLKR